MARLIYTDSSNRECSVYLGPDQPVVSIGRATDCTIRSNRKSVSRHHAEFRFNNGTFEVIDLNSSNGTWLIENEQRFEIEHERLEDQDEIWCGDFVLHFALDDPAEREVTVNNQHPSGQQPYVSGPTEAADAYAFGAEPSSAFVEPEMGDGLGAQASSVAYDYEEIEELGEVDFVEVEEPAGQVHGGHSGQFGPGGGAAPGDYERLLQEKQSIEDLASRQAYEITDLQAQLQAANERAEQLQAQQADSQQRAAEQWQAELDAARTDLEALQHENQQLHEQLHNAPDASAQVDALQHELEAERHQVEQLRGELQQSEDALDGAHQRLEQAQQSQAELERELSVRDRRVEALEHDVRTLEAELADTSGSGADVDRLREQLEQARADLDKNNRLLDEYERRNAELRSELDTAREQNDEFQQAAEQNEAKLAELFDARDELQRRVGELEPAQQELDEARTRLDEAEQLAGDLKAEVQGLKQRLQLERRRAEEGDPAEIEKVEAELVAASERIAELEQERDALRDELEQAQAHPDDTGGLPDAAVDELRQRLGALERLTDAIDRTDLEPLSTVDRIRLQSAIRETDPKKTLQEALELLD